VVLVLISCDRRRRSGFIACCIPGLDLRVYLLVIEEGIANARIFHSYRRYLFQILHILNNDLLRGGSDNIFQRLGELSIRTGSCGRVQRC
jgi:hypothetical protein